MEPSFVTPYLVIIAVVLGVSIFMMRFMPRMMAGVPFVEPKAVHDLMEGDKELVIIDVRTAEEFTSPLGHVPGSINMVELDLDNRLKGAGNKFDSLKAEPVFVICRTQNRSPRAARLLTKFGFTNVAIIKGGMMSWEKQGLPVEK